MSLLRRIKCGLQNIQFNNELLNLSNSNWLAENLRKAIHEQTGNFYLCFLNKKYIFKRKTIN